jgi:hypothetical protein
VFRIRKTPWFGSGQVHLENPILHSIEYGKTCSDPLNHYAMNLNSNEELAERGIKQFSSARHVLYKAQINSKGLKASTKSSNMMRETEKLPILDQQEDMQ